MSGFSRKADYLPRTRKLRVKRGLERWWKSVFPLVKLKSSTYWLVHTAKGKQRPWLYFICIEFSLKKNRVILTCIFVSSLQMNSPTRLVFDFVWNKGSSIILLHISYSWTELFCEDSWSSPGWWESSISSMIITNPLL